MHTVKGSIKETDLIVCSGIIVGEGILFLFIRGFYYIDIMEKYHPHAINMDSYPIDLYSADEKKDKSLIIWIRFRRQLIILKF